MKNKDLARALYGLARRFPFINYQETMLIREAARRLSVLPEGGDGDGGKREHPGPEARPAGVPGQP